MTSRHRPPARGTGFGPHSAASGAPASTSFTRRCSRARRAAVRAWSKAVSQSPIRPRRARHPARTVWALASPAASCSSASFSRGRAHRGFDLVKALGIGEHRKLAVETRAPGRETGGIACGFLQLRNRTRRRNHVACGQQRLTASHQQLRLLVVAVGQLVVNLLKCVQCLVVEVSRAFEGQARRRLVPGTSAVLDGLGRVSRPRTFEVVVGQFGQPFLVGARLGFQCRGDALVQPHASHGGQLGEQRLPDDGVVEPVTTARFLDDDARLARFVEGVDEVLARQRAQLGRRQTCCPRPLRPQGPCSSPPEAEKVCGSRLPEHPAAGCSGPSGRRFRPRGAGPR